MTTFWTLKNGDKIPVENLTTGHIENILKLLFKRGYVGKSDVSFYLSCDEPRGDGAQDAFYAEFDCVTNATIHPFVDIFRQELKQRKELGIGYGSTRRHYVNSG